MALIKKIYPELLAWPAGLLLLYFFQPGRQGASLCLFKNAGLPFCPGCGLGHSIHYLLHGQWETAIRHHWLAPFVVAGLIYRIAQLSILQYSTFKNP
ncbi:DUF2752 domain-containing protein [Chitinophaga solisilvae]|uniref:DUF2752 domain-containing protein n=1 Tax=Chitinophaga solisilvae TaxID=1233460 RepID=A0A3S1CZ53_9BACT|nr:DUF2752 domain-containing protein [Chitinophaga solisilvae]NSL89349.1 DUF2752 domain-containing protein [Chitinophaga solisilvae]